MKNWQTHLINLLRSISKILARSWNEA